MVIKKDKWEKEFLGHFYILKKITEYSSDYVCEGRLQLLTVSDNYLIYMENASAWYRTSPIKRIIKMANDTYRVKTKNSTYELIGR